MSIEKFIKKEIIENWQNSFQDLGIYSQNKLYKKVGPLLIGLELIKLPRIEEYRPYFIIYPLWKDSVKDCLDVPIILKQFYNKKGLQFSISYKNHGHHFDEVAECVRKQLQLSLSSNITLEKITSVIDEYSKAPPLSATSNSYLQAKLQEAKLAIALYVDVKKAQHVMNKIINISWDEHHFKMWDVDIKKWLQDLSKRIEHRDVFLKQITINKQQDRKIERLNESELTA